MPLTKTELIEKLTKVNQAIIGLEDLNDEKSSRFDNLEKAKLDLEKTLKSQKKSLASLIACGIIAGLLYYWQLSFSSSIGIFFVKGTAIFLAVLAVCNLMIFIPECFNIKPSRKKIFDCQDQFDEMDEKFKIFFSQHEQEVNDCEYFFPRDSYPSPKYIQYGIDCLTSGRADDFKEFMNLIDEQIHRDKLENEAKAQTENTRQQAEYARRAAANSAAALIAANAAAWEARRAANNAAAARSNW